MSEHKTGKSNWDQSQKDFYRERRDKKKPKVRIDTVITQSSGPNRKTRRIRDIDRRPSKKGMRRLFAMKDGHPVFIFAHKDSNRVKQAVKVSHKVMARSNARGE